MNGIILLSAPRGAGTGGYVAAAYLHEDEDESMIVFKCQKCKRPMLTKKLTRYRINTDEHFIRCPYFGCQYKNHYSEKIDEHGDIYLELDPYPEKE